MGSGAGTPSGGQGVPPTRVERKPDGGRVEIWEIEGRRHRIGGPARVWFYADGSVRAEEWYHDGVRHREDGPAQVIYNVGGSVRTQAWFRNGELVSEPEVPVPGARSQEIIATVDETDESASRTAPRAETTPAEPDEVLAGDDGGRIERWLSDGQLHRDGGPAEIEYRGDGSVEAEHWYRHGRLHRSEGPAVITYHDGDRIQSETWWRDGQWHRVGGPAVVEYREDGTIEHVAFWVGGRLDNGGRAPVISFDRAGRVIGESWEWGDW